CISAGRFSSIRTTARRCLPLCRTDEVFMPFPLLAFIVIPIAELLLILSVADLIGGWATLGLVILTAFIGINVLKRQGLSTLLGAQDRLRSGQLPAQEIVEGMLLAFAGAMLLTPGFITDTIGF